MKKIRLDVDELRVESFEPGPAGVRAGVRAHEAPTEWATCRIEICSGESLCAAQCTYYDGCSNQGTCVYSCQSEPCVCVPQG